MRKGWLHVLAALGLASACTAGSGPIGVGSIGGREDPGSSSEAAGTGAGAQTPSDTSPTPTAAPTSTAPIGGSFSCTGTFTCTASEAAPANTTFKRSSSDGTCATEYGGAPIKLETDGKLTNKDTGKNVGTWTASSGAILLCDPSNRCATCTPGGSSPMDAGPG